MENWKSNLLRFVVLYAVLAVLFFLLSGGKGTDLANSAKIFYGILGCVYASTIMECMATKEKRVTYLMLPATSFEKYLSRLIYSLVVYTIAFLIAFKLADYTRILIMLLSVRDYAGPVALSSLWIIDNERWTSFFFISQYFFFNSLFVLGGSIWYKKPFPKTIAALGAIALVYSSLFIWFVHLYSGVAGRQIDFPMYGVGWTEPELYLGIVFMVIALFNWTLAYFRFKEAEIINRII